MSIVDSIDVAKILKLLPHRYPFLLVDKVIDYVEGESITAVKNVTFNEPHFQGHFPERPVMPGVLMVEAMAQTAGLLVFCITGKEDSFFFFAGIDNVRFKRVVIPGDQLQIKVTLDRQRKGIWKFSAEASVDGELACTAELMIARDESGDS